MTPPDDDLTRTSPPADATRDHPPPESALDAALAAAFAPDPAATADRPGRDEVAGAVIGGKYTLVEPIGEGGMGAVWRAKQTEPVKRFVAVKLIKAGMDSKQVLARFEAERQALALMDHPHIAKVLDGGLHDGRPYFVMELVKGAPITQFCDANTFTPRQRLELFVQACQAIQHAHQKGVIHRDVKPSNVLVALYDDRPVVKVIDFGVAKATGGTLTEATIDTGFGGVVGTPAYMSPEQATFNNLDIDTRTDVYALGVLLYELLAGSPPFSRRELEAKGLLEVLRVVREEEPPRPSAKLSTADTLPSIAATRGTEPKALTGLLRNELDWVVMKALEKDRTRRYETANGFAADVLRYLSGEPVQAHPPSAAYRLRKFVRRNRGRVVAAGLVLLALVAGVVGTTLGLLRADERRREAEQARAAEAVQRAAAEENARRAAEAAEQERKAKEREAERAAAEKLAREAAVRNLAYAKKGNEILGSVFAGLDPKKNYATVGEFSQALKDNLRKAVDELDGAAIGGELEVAAMQFKLGESLLALGDGRQAVVLFEKATDTCTARLGADHLHTLASKNGLARAHSATGDPKRAVPLFEEVLKARTAELGADHRDTLSSTYNLADAYADAGKYELALPLHERVVKARTAGLGADHPDTLASMNSLGLLYLQVGQLDKARAMFEGAVQARTAKQGADHPDTLNFQCNLAKVHLDAGQPGKALPLLEDTLTRAKTKLGADHPLTLTIMNDLAVGHMRAGQLDKAVPLFEDAVGRMRAKLGADHPHTLTTMNQMAGCYLTAGKHDKALPLFEETLRVRTAKSGGDHPDTLSAMTNLGVGFMTAGKPDKAVPLLEKALVAQKAKLGDDHPYTLGTMAYLGAAYEKAGRADRAVPLLEQALEAQKAKLGADHPSTLITMTNLGVAYGRARKSARAVPLLEDALRRMKAKLGDDHPHTLTTAVELAGSYTAAGMTDKGLALYQDALERAKAKRGTDHPETLIAMINLAHGYEKAGRVDKALPLFEEGVTRMRAALGADHPNTLSATLSLANAHGKAGKIDKALPLFEEALDRGADPARGIGHLGDMALDCWTKRRFDEAIRVGRVALPRAEKAFGRGHTNTLAVVLVMGLSHQDAGRPADAIPLLEEVYRASKTNPDVARVEGLLMDAYTQAGRGADAGKLVGELLADARKRWPADSPRLAGQLAQCGWAVLAAKGYAEAEPLLREALTIREKKEPDTWTTFNTRSMLGAALLGQKKYAEAEPLLVKGYEGLKAREEAIPELARADRLRLALDWLVELYTATGQPDEAKKYRELRAKYPAAKETLPPPRADK